MLQDTGISPQDLLVSWVGKLGQGGLWVQNLEQQIIHLIVPLIRHVTERCVPSPW